MPDYNLKLNEWINTITYARGEISMHLKNTETT